VQAEKANAEATIKVESKEGAEKPASEIEE
jgi:hypothetical protein